MEALHIDLTAIVGILIGGLVLLIPIVGLTARMVVPAIMESIARARASQGSSRMPAALEMRLVRMERQIESLRHAAPSAPEAMEVERKVVSLGL